MANNTSNLQERMSEARATAEASSVIRILNDTVMDPSTKRFAKGRAARIERWQQLMGIAQTQINGLQGIARSAAPKRAAKARAETGGANIQAVPKGTKDLVPDDSGGVLITHAETAQQTA